MKTWKLILPVLIASVLLGLLFFAILAAVTEATDTNSNKLSNAILLGILGLNWLFWTVVLFIKYKGSEHIAALNGIITNVLSGSLVTLLIAIPAHIYVERRHGCFVGMATSLSVSIGIVVALWAFGPGIFILFLEEKRKLAKKQG